MEADVRNTFFPLMKTNIEMPQAEKAEALRWKTARCVKASETKPVLLEFGEQGSIS